MYVLPTYQKKKKIKTEKCSFQEDEVDQHCLVVGTQSIGKFNNKSFCDIPHLFMIQIVL